MEFREFSAKTIDAALTEATIQLGTTSDQIEFEVIEKGSSGLLGFGSKNALIRAKKKYSPVDDARDFLVDVTAAMGLHVEVKIEMDEESRTMDIELTGDEMGVLIGKRGQTLDALQYLANLAVNKNSEEYLKIKVDTEDYRKRRKDTLEGLAKNIAFKVKRTKRAVSLEPMNPYERRIIHSALQGDRYVSTHSEGDEPFRHVVVTLKRS
ncbi:MAG: protein jag [Lachnospiraceae bacterium]|jgi:spoIIIJ-associated protein|nr:protein jag [Lachnospiraceae bacterium]